MRELIAAGVDVNASTRYGWTPLMGAAQGGYLEIVQVLLAEGADMEATSKFGWTALISAAFSGKTEVVKYLASEGASFAQGLGNLQILFSYAVVMFVASFLLFDFVWEE